MSGLFRDASPLDLESRNPQFAADYARQLAGRLFGKRVSTLFWPGYIDQPWAACFDDYADGKFMSRGRTEAQAIKHLIEHALQQKRAA